jgi:hypothetical protein
MNDTITITPRHIWAVVEWDVGRGKALNDEGAADFFALLHRYIIKHKIKSFAQWGRSRALVKVRSVVASDFARELGDIIDVNVTERRFFERDGHGQEKIPN